LDFLGKERYSFTGFVHLGQHSQLWWSRLGGFLLRVAHRIPYISHVGLLYVDDFIFVQDAKVLPISAAALLVFFFRVINLPISWKKCELSHTITWIGWKFNFYSGLVAVHPDKQKKILDLISSLLKHNRVPLKVIQKVVGLPFGHTTISFDAHLAPPSLHGHA
jgi:hypothetical protein